MKTEKTKPIFSGLIFIAALVILSVCGNSVFAQKVDDGKPEPVPVEVRGFINTPYAGDQPGGGVNITNEWIKQDTIPFGSGQLDVALHEKSDAVSGVKEMTVAASATGKGADFRDWNIDSIKLYIDGVVIMPDTMEKFYITKQSMFRLPAAFLFACIGSQYEQNAQSYKSGEVCPVTDQQKTVERTGGEKSDFGKGIDKVGMAAGMGLLTAQAKGEISAQKCKFVIKVADAVKLDGADDKIKVVIENKEKHQKETVEVNIPKMPQPVEEVAPKPVAMPEGDTFISATNPETGETMTARKNADGSTTITKTDASGKEISERTESAPAGGGAASGSTVEAGTNAKVVGWTENDGSTTITKTYPNGSRTVTKTDKAGKVISRMVEPAPGAGPTLRYTAGAETEAARKFAPPFYGPMPADEEESPYKGFTEEQIKILEELFRRDGFSQNLKRGRSGEKIL